MRRHAGARHVVVTDVNPYRLELARRIGVTRAVDVRTVSLGDVQRELGMREGFDVGLEMSGNAAAFRSMLENMCHGGKIALLGIPSGDVTINWHLVVFNMLTIKGIYGREMYETWYKMTVMLESGLDIRPVITHRMPYTEFEQAFALIESRHRAPLVRLGIFRSRTLLGANAVMLVFGTLPIGLSFILTLYAQEVLGYSAVKFGLTSLIFPAMAAIGSILGQGLVLRVGFRPVATIGNRQRAAHGSQTK